MALQYHLLSRINQYNEECKLIGYNTEAKMNAKLPDFLEQRKLSDLMIGETVWTVPWAMFADDDGDLWLYGNFSYHEGPGGTVSMKVSKTGSGYVVDISECKDYRWSRDGESSAVMVKKGNSIPVTKLKGHSVVNKALGR